MKVFISWSGERSHALAQKLRVWLPNVIQLAEPIVSSEDIGKGVRWYEEIARNLDDADVGVIVVTPENVEKPWINFEAGALARMLSARRACPLLLGMTTTELLGPLAGLNATEATSRDDMRRLVLSIVPPQIPHAVVERSFDREWDELEVTIKEIAAREVTSAGPRPTERELLGEILSMLRHPYRPEPVPRTRDPLPSSMEVTSRILGMAEECGVGLAEKGINVDFGRGRITVQMIQLPQSEKDRGTFQQSVASLAKDLGLSTLFVREENRFCDEGGPAVRPTGAASSGSPAG